jgi:hypothetical protein
VAGGREELLPGGNLAGPVVRVGDAVRRPAGPWTPAVHALLRHLEAAGFAGAPRVLGLDAHGRELLSWIPGRSFFPPETSDAVWSPGSLRDLGRMLRAYHDACAGFAAPAGAAWEVMVGAPSHGDAVCHNDISPWNTIFHRGRPQALVDWDLAAPAPRVWDVAYAAWHFVPLCEDRRAARRPLPPRAPRLRAFLDAYGLDDRSTLLDVVEERQQVHVRTIRAWGGEGRPGWRELLARGYAELPVEDARWLSRHRRELERALR